MYKLIVIFVFLLMSSSFPALAVDLEAEEIELRETPQKMYDRLNQSIAFPISFQNREQFKRIAQEQDYSSDEFKHILQLLARLNLEPNVKSKVGFENANNLIELLASIAHTPLEHASVAMLRGRYIGRTEQKYQEAIAFYNQALTQINDSADIESMLLKHTIHEHLGGLHLVIRQDAPALMHFHHYRDIAYKLKNPYLIATAEAKLGHYYNKNQQLTKSLQHYSEAIRLSNGAKYPSMKTHLHLQLAKVYRDLKQWNEALNNAHEAAEGFKKLDNDTYLSSCMTVIAMIYGEQGDWNRAIDYYLNAQQLDAKRGNYIAQGLNFHNLGQAYSNLNDDVNALKYLLMANKVFVDKQSHHYLVYNELLISEIAQAKQDWSMMMAHAEHAFTLATSLNLLEEQKSALAQIAVSAEQQQDQTKVINTQKKIIELNNTSVNTAKDSAVAASLVAEQQLTLELNMIQGKLTDAINAAKNTGLFLKISFFITSLLMIAMIILLKQQRKSKQQHAALLQRSLQEPFTLQQGYAALLNDLSQNSPNNPTNALALIEFGEHIATDLTYGQYFANAISLELATKLKATLAMPIYVIRQGVFAVRFTEAVTPPQVMMQLQQQLNNQANTTTFNLGFINLPLVAKEEINIAPQLLFETVQMALAGARSLPSNTSHYVSLRALDFVPPTLFADPLFLQLTKGIERGLIRVETDAIKEDIVWPNWENNPNRHLLANI